MSKKLSLLDWKMSSSWACKETPELLTLGLSFHLKIQSRKRVICCGITFRFVSGICVFLWIIILFFWWFFGTCKECTFPCHTFPPLAESISSFQLKQIIFISRLPTHKTYHSSVHYKYLVRFLLSVWFYGSLGAPHSFGLEFFESRSDPCHSSFPSSYVRINVISLIDRKSRKRDLSVMYTVSWLNVWSFEVLARPAYLLPTQTGYMEPTYVCACILLFVDNISRW